MALMQPEAVSYTHLARPWPDDNERDHRTRLPGDHAVSYTHLVNDRNADQHRNRDQDSLYNIFIHLCALLFDLSKPRQLQLWLPRSFAA